MRFLRVIAIVTPIVLSLALFMTVTIAAQEKKPAAKEKEVVSIDGDQWKWRGDGDRSMYTITGNVVVKHLDTTLTADRAEYDEKARVIVVTGNLKIVDPENVITGEKGTAYLKDRKSVVEGNVKLVAQPKPDPNAKSESVRAKLKEPANIICDKLEYLYRKKIATAQGNLKVTQKSRVLLGEKAVYDAGQELVTMTGGVRVTDEKGQTFTSPGTVKVSTKEGAEWIEAEKGSASLKVDLDEEMGEGESKSADKSQETKE